MAAASATPKLPEWTVTANVEVTDICQVCRDEVSERDIEAARRGSVEGECKGCCPLEPLETGHRVEWSYRADEGIILGVEDIAFWACFNRLIIVKDGKGGWKCSEATGRVSARGYLGIQCDFTVEITKLTEGGHLIRVRDRNRPSIRYYIEIDLDAAAAHPRGSNWLSSPMPIKSTE